MYDRIKFHTYRDIISEQSVTVSQKREKTTNKRLSELYSLFWKRSLQTSQAIDWGLRMPRTQQHLQKTSPQLSPSEQQYARVSILTVGTQQDHKK